MWHRFYRALSNISAFISASRTNNEMYTEELDGDGYMYLDKINNIGSA